MPCKYSTSIYVLLKSVPFRIIFFSQNSAIEIKGHNQHFGHNEICILLMVICIHNINMEKREKLQKTNLKPLITNPVVPRGFISCSLDGFVPWQSTGYVICQNQSIIIKTNNKRSIWWPLNLQTIIVLKTLTLLAWIY